MASKDHSITANSTVSSAFAPLQAFPAWFAVVAAFIYGTGFLCVFTFHNSYNIHGINYSVLQIQYAYTGLMCLAIPLILGGGVAALISNLRSCERSTLENLRVVIFVLIAFDFYFFVLFAPPGAFVYTTVRIGILVVLFTVLAGIWGEYITTKPKHTMVVRLAGIVSLLVGGLLVTWSYLPTIAVMFKKGGYLYFLFSCFLGVIAAQVFQNFVSSSVSYRMMRVAFGAIAFALTYFFTVLLYGYGVYHYIPASNGGADFSHGARIKLKLESSRSQVLPDWLYARNDTHSLVLVEAGVKSIFVANPHEKINAYGQDVVSRPQLWRQGRPYRPRVLEIPRSKIKWITHMPTNQKNRPNKNDSSLE